MDLEEWLSLQSIDLELFLKAFSEQVWTDPSLYVWRGSEESLSRIFESLSFRTSPIVVVAGIYGIGKSSYIYALKHLVSTSNMKNKIFEIPVTISNCSEYSFLRMIGDSMNLRGEFGKNYPKDRLSVFTTIENMLKGYAKQNDLLTLIVDDAHELGEDALMIVKGVCDIRENGQRICPVILCSEPIKLEQMLSGSRLAQVKERNQETTHLQPFDEIETLELIARAVSYARGEPKDVRWRFDVTRDMNTINPFTPASIRVLFDSVLGVPRYIKPACRIACQIQADISDRLPQDQKFQVSPNIMQEAIEEAKRRRG